MKTEQYTCDGCGAKRGETNHWYLITSGGRYVHVSRWRDELCVEDGVLHYCGASCVLKAVSEFLGRANEAL